MLRIGIVGAGNIVRGRHVEAWLEQVRAGAAQVVAIADVDQVAAKSISAMFANDGPPPTMFADYKDMITNGEIDAVDICLPHHLHADAILAAAAAGKHILCEKPMCIDLADADRIIAAVDAASVTYMSAHNELFFPAIQAGLQLIERGGVGKPYIIRSHEFPMRYGKPDVPGRAAPETMMVGWRASKATMGGGVLIDKGYHPTYILLRLAASEPVSVTAMAGTFVANMDGEDTALVLVKFADGSIGQIFTGEGWAFPANDAKFHVIGERGEVYGDRYDAYYRPRGFERSALLPNQDERGESTFNDEIAHFVDSVATGRKPIQDHHDGRRVLEVIQAAYRSLDEGRTVELPLSR